MATNRLLYDTGWRVGMPLPSQGRKHEVVQSSLAVGRTAHEDHRACKYLGNNLWDCGHNPEQLGGCDCHVCYPFVIEEYFAYGLPAVRQNGMLDGRVYKQSGPMDLAIAMNAIAGKIKTGVHHWVTNDVIHWAFISFDDTTEVTTVHDWGIL